MKKIIVLIVAIIALTNFVNAQGCIPNYIHLTAVARDTTFPYNPIDSAHIDVEVQITDSANTVTYYCESQLGILTNHFGEFSIEIGTALWWCPPHVSLNAVPWDSCNLWYHISYRPNTLSGNFIPIASNHFSTVPYAFASRTAAELLTPGATTGQVLTWNGTAWVPQNTSGVQTISYTSSTGNVALSGGGGNYTTPTASSITKYSLNQVTNTVRNTWIDVPALDTIVPVTGTYLIMASARLWAIADNERSHFRIRDVTTSTDLAKCFLNWVPTAGPTNGGDVTGSITNMVNLTAGDLIHFEYEVIGTGVGTYYVVGDSEGGSSVTLLRIK